MVLLGEAIFESRVTTSEHVPFNQNHNFQSLFSPAEFYALI